MFVTTYLNKKKQQILDLKLQKVDNPISYFHLVFILLFVIPLYLLFFGMCSKKTMTSGNQIRSSGTQHLSELCNFSCCQNIGFCLLAEHSPSDEAYPRTTAPEHDDRRQSSTYNSALANLTFMAEGTQTKCRKQRVDHFFLALSPFLCRQPPSRVYLLLFLSCCPDTGDYIRHYML